MKHRTWWCNIIWKYGCPVCKVRQMQYGFRLNPIGYMKEREGIKNNPMYSAYERVWMLNKCKPIEIDYE